MADDHALKEWRRLSEGGAINRAIAARLGLAEAQLLAAGCGSITTRLVPNAAELLQALSPLGVVKFVVRNDHAVMERSGTLKSIETEETVVATGAELGLVLSQAQVASAFALKEPRDSATKRSLQLFDARGETVLKIVCRDETSADTFERIIQQFRHDDQSAPELQSVTPAPGAVSAATRGSPASLADFLHAAAASGRPLRISVSNRGARLEASTPIHRVKRSSRAPWINVLDPGLDLHLHEARITHCEEHEAGGTRHLQWLADDGSPVVTMESQGSLEWRVTAPGKS